jgi:hypothetical protein
MILKTLKHINHSNIFYAMLLLAFFLNLRLGLIGIHHPITEQHSFRQTQTAISTFYLIKDGFTIDYITPVLGAPWRIPFEFPTYQLAVAFVYKAFNYPLDLTGRIVSLTIFYLTVLIVLASKKLFNPDTRKIIAFLMLVHPIYIFWSRTFMIESTALFFSIVYLFSGILFLKEQNSRQFFLFLIFGILASLTKVTTFANALVCLGIYILISLFAKEDKTKRLLSLTYLGLAIGVMLAIFFLWNSHVDKLKELSELASVYTSNKLKIWSFGTIQSRFEIENWIKIISNSSYTFGLGFGLLVFGVLKKVSDKMFWAFLITGLISPLIFFNLYKVHNYYHYASTLFILVSFAILLDQYKTTFNLSIVASFIFFIGIYKYQYLDYQYETISRPVLVGAECKKILNPTDNMVLVGAKWSSEIPYYAERKGVCITDDALKILKEDPTIFLHKIKTDNIKLLILSGNSFSDTSQAYVSHIRKFYGLNRKKIIPDIQASLFYKY